MYLLCVPTGNFRRPAEAAVKNSLPAVSEDRFPLIYFLFYLRYRYLYNLLFINLILCLNGFPPKLLTFEWSRVPIVLCTYEWYVFVFEHKILL